MKLHIGLTSVTDYKIDRMARFVDGNRIITLIASSIYQPDTQTYLNTITDLRTQNIIESFPIWAGDEADAGAYLDEDAQLLYNLDKPVKFQSVALKDYEWIDQRHPPECTCLECTYGADAVKFHTNPSEY